MFKRQIALGAAAMLLVGCTADQPEPTGTGFEVTVPLYAAGGNKDFNLGTHLTGDEEFFPAAPGAPTRPIRTRKGRRHFG